MGTGHFGQPYYINVPLLGVLAIYQYYQYCDCDMRLDIIWDFGHHVVI